MGNNTLIRLLSLAGTPNSNRYKNLLKRHHIHAPENHFETVQSLITNFEPILGEDAGTMVYTFVGTALEKALLAANIDLSKPIRVTAAYAIRNTVVVNETWQKEIVIAMDDLQSHLDAILKSTEAEETPDSEENEESIPEEIKTDEVPNIWDEMQSTAKDATINAEDEEVVAPVKRGRGRPRKVK